MITAAGTTSAFRAIGVVALAVAVGSVALTSLLLILRHDVAVGIANAVRGRNPRAPHALARPRPDHGLAKRSAATARLPGLTARPIARRLSRLTLRLAAFLTRDNISARRRVLADQWLLKMNVDSPRVSDEQLLRVVHTLLDAQTEARIATAAWMAGPSHKTYEDSGKLIAVFYAAHKAVTTAPSHTDESPVTDVFTYNLASNLIVELQRKILPVISETGPHSYISGQA
jgi:hypothetical protein